MNSHIRWWKRVSERRVGRVISLLLLGALAWWVIAANLGCGGDWWDEVTRYTIQAPGSIHVSQPGETGQHDASLWGPGFRFPREATTWSIEGNLPRILASANLSPEANSHRTTISWAAADDASLFAGDDLFAATGDKSYHLALKARFIPLPVGDEPEQTADRTAHISLISTLPRFRVENRFSDFSNPVTESGLFRFRVHVENRLLNARYLHRVNFDYLQPDGQFFKGPTTTGFIDLELNVRDYSDFYVETPPGAKVVRITIDLRATIGGKILREYTRRFRFDSEPASGGAR